MSKPTDRLKGSLRKHYEEYVEKHGSNKGVWNVFKGCGVSTATISRIAHGDSGEPKDYTWSRLYEHAPHIVPKPPWLYVTADGKLDFNVFKSGALATDEELEYPDDVKQMLFEEFGTPRKTSDHTTIPMAQQKVSAGTGQLLIETDKISDLAFRVDWLAKRGGKSNKVVLRITGRSMEPVLSDGDVILVDQSGDGKIIHDGQLYVVNDPENGVLVKQVRLAQGGLHLISFNSFEFPPVYLPVPEGEVSPIIGRVIWWGHSVDPD